jgi:hypothetical protein
MRCARRTSSGFARSSTRSSLIGTRSSGPFTLSRDEWLDAIQRRELISIEIDVQDSALFENVMVGTVEARWRLSYLGRESRIASCSPTSGFREDGRWQVVRRHSSPIPPKFGRSPQP